MQIREIHIDRFGIFSNSKVMEISPGLSVIYGKNEFGKTTLLEFIRWVLFGFENKRKGMNFYDPVAGGVHAGTLVCEMFNGERVFISRKGGSREGKVTIRTADWEGEGQSNLEMFIGHASRKIFKNIYAFALDELQDLDSLMEDEIKNKLLGAGMGLGQVSLNEVENEIRKKREEVFLLRGSKPVMNQKFREIKKLEEDIRSRSQEIDRYDELNKKIWVLEKMRATAETTSEKLESRRRSLEIKRELFPDFIDLEDKTQRRNQIEGIPEIEEDAMLAFEKIQAKIEDLIPRMEEEKVKLQQLILKREPIVFNQNLLDRETEIIQLRQLTELVRTAQADKHAVQLELDQLNDRIQLEVEAVQKEWNEEQVLALEWTDSEKQFVQKQEQVLHLSEQFVTNVKNRLELHQEQQVTDSSRPKNLPGGVLSFSWLLLGMGIAGVGYAFWASNIELGIFMSLILVIGLGLSIWLSFNRTSENVEDLLENLLNSKLLKAEKDWEKEIQVWQQWVKEKGLDPETSPALFRELQVQVREIRDWILQRNNLEERINRMRDKEEEARYLVEDLAECAGGKRLTNDLLVNIEMLCQHYDETRENFHKARDLDAQIHEQSGRVEGVTVQFQNQQDKMAHLLKSVGVDSQENFLRQWHMAQEKKSLDQAIREVQRRIQKRVGMGESCQAFLDSMRETHPDQLEQELTEVHSRLNDLQEQQNRVNQEIGQFRGEASQLASREDLLSLQNELEAKKEQLTNGAREWATLTLALDMLDQAKVQYEKNRQPQVFQAASRMFSRITDGNYLGVEKPLESDQFRIVQPSGASVNPVQLSRGTREQLYFSMRLGLIEDYETRAEPLPLIMDDVFVNFDDTRREHVLNILREFSRDRQVIILSCHEYLLDTYLKYGANQVAFRA